MTQRDSDQRQNPGVRNDRDDCLQEQMDLDALFAPAQKTQMPADRKALMRSAIRAYAAEHPVREKRRWFAFGWSTQWKAAYASLLLVATGGQVCFAAEAAVPGDALYPVKININETVFSALALSPEAQTDWATTQAERRLQEAEELIARSRLTPDVQAILIEKIEWKMQEVAEGAAALEASGDPDASNEAAERILEIIQNHAPTLRRLRMQILLQEALDTESAEVTTVSSSSAANVSSIGIQPPADTVMEPEQEAHPLRTLKRLLIRRAVRRQ